MMSGLARNSGIKQELLGRLRQKLAHDENARLRPAEALMVLEWAIDCDDVSDQADLLNIFDIMGGLTLMKDALADRH